MVSTPIQKLPWAGHPALCLRLLCRDHVGRRPATVTPRPAACAGRRGQAAASAGLCGLAAEVDVEWW